MQIVIDSRNVNAFKLKIWDKEKLLFDDIVFSQPEKKINLAEFKGDYLRIEWDFYFTEEEVIDIKTRKDYPVEGMYSYYIEHEKSMNDILPMMYIEPASSLYYAIIEKIQSSCKILKLSFIETNLATGLNVINIASKGDKKFGRIHYKKREDAKEILAVGKTFFKENMRKDAKKPIIYLLLFILWSVFLFGLLKINDITLVILTILLALFVIFIWIVYITNGTLYKELENNTRNIDAFVMTHKGAVAIEVD